MIIDGDTHTFEPRGLWRDRVAAKDQELAIEIVDDPLGYSWLTARGTSIGIPAFVYEPLDFVSHGRMLEGWRAGRPNDHRPYDEMPEYYWNASARRDRLDGWGIDEMVLFPNWGFIWEFKLAGDLDSTRVNMAAWNRWAIELAQEGQGRLHPVGHVTLAGETTWLRRELEALSAAGVRLALMAPGLIDGRRPSHPDFDHVWAMFVDCGITPAWHINSQMMTVLDRWEAWTDHSEETHAKAVPGLFPHVAAQLALCDLAVGGVFERFPDLRVLIAELGSEWFPSLTQRLDGVYGVLAQFHGRPVNPDLPRSPGEYLQDRVTIVCSFPHDVHPLLQGFAANAAFGSDHPHPEGVADPLHDYRSAVGTLDTDVEPLIFGENLRPLLHQ